MPMKFLERNLCKTSFALKHTHIFPELHDKILFTLEWGLFISVHFHLFNDHLNLSKVKSSYDSL